MKITGTIILIVGLMITAFAGFKFSTEKKVVDIGKLEITRDKNHVLAWSPYIGVAVMLVGGGILFYDAKRK